MPYLLYRFDPGNQEALRFLNEDDIIGLAKSAHPLVSVVLHRLVEYTNGTFPFFRDSDDEDDDSDDDEFEQIPFGGCDCGYCANGSESSDDGSDDAGEDDGEDEFADSDPQHNDILQAS